MSFLLYVRCSRCARTAPAEREAQARGLLQSASDRPEFKMPAGWREDVQGQTLCPPCSDDFTKAFEAFMTAATRTT